MTNRRTFSLVVVVLAIGLTGLTSRQVPAGPSGHWEGTIEVPGQALGFAIDLAEREGKWDATITIPAQNIKGFALSDVAVKGDTVGFAMKGVPGDPRFAGKVSKDGRSISGDFSQGGQTMPFTLAWKGEAKFEAAPKSTPITSEIEGSWEGALNANGTVLRLVLKLSNREGGATGTLVSVDQSGTELPITSIVQSASHLKLIVSAVGGAFEGDLKDGQIAGTWTQSGTSLPLVLKRPAR